MNSFLNPISPLAGIMNSNLVYPLTAEVILTISAFLGPIFSITAPMNSSGTSIVKYSIGSIFLPFSSLKITFGLETCNSKPSLLIVSIRTDKWSSPLPDTSKQSGVISLTLKLTLVSNSFINLSLKCLDVTNSPLPANGESFTIKFMLSVGSSISTNGKASGLAASAIVSPMLASTIPLTAIISPNPASSTSSLFNPLYPNTAVIL